MEILKGVHLIDVYANSYVLIDDRLVLIDTSSEPDAKTILRYLEKAKIRPRDLATIFITHVHPDHVSGLARLKQDATGTKVAASRVEADFISKKRVYDGPPGAAHQRHPGTPVDVVLEDGQAYDGLKVIYTPGHTRGSISLLDESRSLLIAGDAANNEKALSTMDDVYNVDPRQHRESIRKLATLHFDNAVFGHGKPITGGASAQFVALAKRL
ncbi:MAG TPA: MBL fold metallo-hydrolase [Thermoplasmata archaeon]|nr:MBL fold metallo-hydrolase [Thermoplasmata archaeon]